MRFATILLALGLPAAAFAAPKTSESLCGAILLTDRAEPAPERADIFRYLDHLSSDGALDADEAVRVKSAIVKGAAPTVLAIKGDSAIAEYLNRFNAALTEFDELGFGAYRNLRPPPSRLAGEVAKGLIGQAAGLLTATFSSHTVGVTAAFVGLSYLLSKIARAGYGWLAFYARTVHGGQARLLTAEAQGAFTDVIRNGTDEKVAYAVTVSLDREYAEALQSAKDLTELPVKALGRALLRRRNHELAAFDLVNIHQALFPDPVDGKNVLMTIVRVRRGPPRPRGGWKRRLGRALTINWSTENTLPSRPAVIEIHKSF